MGAVKYDFEQVLAEAQLDVGKFVAPIPAARLEGEQLPVPVEFGIPAVRQLAAQGRDGEARRASDRAIGNEQTAADRALPREGAGERLHIAGRRLRRLERAEKRTVRIHAISAHPKPLGNAVAIRGQARVETRA